jgi:hypothetical protein
MTPFTVVVFVAAERLWTTMNGREATNRASIVGIFMGDSVSGDAGDFQKTIKKCKKKRWSEKRRH